MLGVSGSVGGRDDQRELIAALNAIFSLKSFGLLYRGVVQCLQVPVHQDE